MFIFEQFKLNLQTIVLCACNAIEHDQSSKGYSCWKTKLDKDGIKYFLKKHSNSYKLWLTYDSLKMKEISCENSWITQK